MSSLPWFFGWPYTDNAAPQAGSGMRDTGRPGGGQRYANPSGGGGAGSGGSGGPGSGGNGGPGTDGANCLCGCGNEDSNVPVCSVTDRGLLPTPSYYPYDPGPFDMNQQLVCLAIQ